MQWADGKKAFEYGYRKMLDKFRDDPARLQYIHELYKDPKKALWKSTFSFTNAVVVDVCESLFSALKTWALGRSKRGVSLLLAVVRIVEGSRLMMLRPFLHKVSSACTKILGRNQPAIVTFIFRELANKLTRRALRMMFDSVTKSWANYDVTVHDQRVISVTNRYFTIDMIHYFTT